MNLLETMLSRRSIRQYSREAIPEEKLNRILQAGLLAPSSRNLKPCQFYVIHDRETLMDLARAKAMGAAMLKNCDTAIAVLSDSEKADTWIEDSSIALSFMMLMAQEQEIGSCWCQIHLRSSAEEKDAEEAVRDILSIDRNMRIAGILALGMPEKRIPEHTLDELSLDKGHYI